ncbi:MAG TPA: 50S ribosomal protein L22 [candidate division Zixibacteria bacterium]|nr:50S ribosomal protein L22 [candidate division Zixibacteria bacterium]
MVVTGKARLRYVSIPPRKMRLVAGLVKGLPVEKALGILNYTPKVAARHMAKTLKSAAANVLSKEGTDHLHPEDLVIKKILVDAAPMAKRIRYRSMGRVYRYYKRYCHLTIEIEGRADTPAPKRASARSAKTEEAGEKAGAKTKSATKKRSAKKTAARAKAKAKTGAAKKTTAKKAKAKPAAKAQKKSEE